MSEVAVGSPKAAAAVRRRRWSRVWRGALWLLGIVAAGLGVVAALVVVQGTYTEVRHADAILVLPGACPPPPDEGAPPCGTGPLDYALDLYRRGFAGQLILIGQEAVAPERAYLLAQGFPDGALVLEDEQESRQAQIKSAAELARARGVSSLLVVGAPPQMLLSLKMARDLDMVAYGAPQPGAPAFVPLDVARESLAYWRYVLGV
jgi:uncharacterized SAM-binding protein YcdF (DUF218 family)